MRWIFPLLEASYGLYHVSVVVVAVAVAVAIAVAVVVAVAIASILMKLVRFFSGLVFSEPSKVVHF